MTKQEVINFVKSEIECGNSILTATLGNGGAGESLVNNNSIIDILESFEFVGEVEPSDDIAESTHYDASWHTYQFNGANGFYIQIQAI